MRAYLITGMGMPYCINTAKWKGVSAVCLFSTEKIRPSRLFIFKQKKQTKKQEVEFHEMSVLSEHK
jgi:hypothetical protein